jgi:hypothetical protein
MDLGLGWCLLFFAGVLAGACASDDDDECADCRAWYDDCLSTCDDSDEECPAGCLNAAWESEMCSGCSLE